jgi:hypothetical protein
LPSSVASLHPLGSSITRVELLGTVKRCWVIGLPTPSRAVTVKAVFPHVEPMVIQARATTIESPPPRP